MKLNKAQTECLAEGIEPVVRFVLGNREDPDIPVQSDDGFPYYIEPVEAYQHFLNVPAAVRPARDLEKLATIHTSWETANGRVLPTVAGVIQQIPKKYLEQTVAFEIENTRHSINTYNFDDGTNSVETVLYRRSMPKIKRS